MAKVTSDQVPGIVKAALWVGGGIAALSIMKNIHDDLTFDGEGEGHGTSHDDPGCGHFPNMKYSLQQYKGWADEIESALWNCFLGWCEDDSRAAEVLMYMQTDGDVSQLICAYGVRGRGVVIGEYYNLPQSVAGMLDDDYIDLVNEYYESVGITYRF